MMHFLGTKTLLVLCNSCDPIGQTGFYTVSHGPFEQKSMASHFTVHLKYLMLLCLQNNLQQVKTVKRAQSR